MSSGFIGVADALSSRQPGGTRETCVVSDILTLERTELLLVDDREDNLLALEGLLAREDLKLLRAKSGRDALELLLGHDVALALVDVHMPEMDGFELAELMRGTERTRHVPIIFVTAGASDNQRVFRGYDAGAVDFLCKPIEPHILRNKVETFVELHRQRAQLRAQLMERERLVRELTETLRVNEMFTAVLGHDLRSPLGAILSAAEVLLRRSEDARVRDVAARFKSAGTRMARMIDDMLDLARVRLAGGIPVDVQPLELMLLIDRARAEIQLTHSRCELRVSHKGDLSGRWDADRLLQLLSNLLTNAVVHGAPGAPITIEADGSSPHDVRLSIGNAGVIAAEHLQHLFDPFRTVATAPHHSHGLGLGLFIVQQIALAHGGEVTVASRAPEGTTFTVRLPRVRA